MSNFTSPSTPRPKKSKSKESTHVVVLLDVSGSMETIRGDVVV